MLRIRLRPTRIRAQLGREQALDPRLEPEAGVAYEAMNEACGEALVAHSAFVSVIDHVHGACGCAPAPTRCGHNYGLSVDLDLDTSLANLRDSGVGELVAAGRNPAALGRWTRKFGWSQNRRRPWHLNYLASHGTLFERIETEFAPWLRLDNAGVQRALNELLVNKLSESLVIDGILGPETGAAAKLTEPVLGVREPNAFGVWFRRVLAAATAEITETDDVDQQHPQVPE